MKCFKDVDGKIPCTKEGDLVARSESHGIVLVQKDPKRRPPFGPLFDPEMFSEVGGSER